ncbi:transposase [Pseudahrensia aquimaris]|uniref:Transposase n=1 Tax=Pseudahrensia aquimaris TaxID=744461 RepID=A0ABW3FGK1_9HYPH
MQRGKKGNIPRHIGRAKSGLNSKLQALSNNECKPIVMVLTAGQVSDHIVAKTIYHGLPNAKTLIGDKEYNSDEFPAALKTKGMASCIPPRAKRNNPAKCREPI